MWSLAEEALGIVRTTCPIFTALPAWNADVV